jgi:flagellar biosynthesis GTPase FlhF
MDERMNIFRQQIFSDVARKDHSEEIEVDVAAINKKSDYFYKEIYNDYTEKGEYYQTNLTEKAENRFYPLPFKPYYMSNTEMSTMIFDSATKRWLSKDHLNYMERKKVAEYQKQISDSLIKRFVDFQSAKSLVELLTKIPNFNINLTEQEKDVIGENGNVLVIGRSGTGKTTCAILRLFSIEMLFKIRLSIYKKKYEDTVKDVRCES